MQHTSIKIVELIHSLENNTLEEINILLQNEVSIKHEVKILFEIIYKNKKNNSISNTENLFKAVYKKQKHTPNEFRKLCHELLQKVENCLANIYLKNDEDLKQYLLLKFYRKNSLFNFYEGVKNKITKHEIVTLSSYHFQINNLIQESHYETLIEDKTRTSENYIQPYSNSLDEYYILQKLKLICHAYNEQHFTTYTSLPNYTETLLNIDCLQYNILVQIYNKIAKILQDINTENNYYEVKKIILKTKNIQQDDLKLIIQYLNNYCVIKINKGASIFIQELFEMYKYYNKTIKETIVSPVRFNNNVNIASKLKEYNYAFQYIEKNGKKLPAELQNSIIAFSKAKLFYEEKKYDNVIEILRKEQYEDLTFNLNSKVLLVKTFYEKKEIQFLDSYLETFRIYILRNKKMNTALKKTHQDFIKIIHKLIKLEFANEKEMEIFKNKISNNKNLPDKLWILEKLDEV